MDEYFLLFIIALVSQTMTENHDGTAFKLFTNVLHALSNKQMANKRPVKGHGTSRLFITVSYLTSSPAMDNEGGTMVWRRK